MLSDKFYPTTLQDLLAMSLKQLENKTFFGIPSGLFFQPDKNDRFRTFRYGQLLETPLGVAAGPHTQLSQNIVAAWLTGSRFIELKTIQTLDELEIPKPCIDMQDEGYNCEWSQELKIQESFSQYLDAWIMIHILQHKLGFDGKGQRGFIFNMSIGYNFDGIMNSNVQWFLDKMTDASQELKQKTESIKHIYPEISQIDIHPCLSDNVTLSTMHGCPPDEIEKIAHYLLSVRKLHTAVKLNPTLLGMEFLRQIMRDSGFETHVPDQAFAHDLKYPEAIAIIRNLQKTAKENNRHFSLKLTNTLESVNHKEVFGEETGMIYNSGRSLHPISINLALKLQEEFQGTLDISFSGGAHAFNVADIIRCGLWPVTVCTDLLKPGGYGRMYQYAEQLREQFADNLPPTTAATRFLETGKQDSGLAESLLNNLRVYAKHTLADSQYKKQEIHNISIKTNRELGAFDCIDAPCVATCPTNQDIPAYNYYAGKGDFAMSAQIVLQTNPFPRTTGMICDHQCQFKCTRINYDQAVQIREIKRFVAEHETADLSSPTKIAHGIQQKSVAIVGAGPSGLSAARFLAQAGFHVVVFEQKSKPGGMVSGVIPPFRLTDQAIAADVERIEALGVKIQYGFEVNAVSFDDLRKRFDYLHIAAGAQKSSRLNIPGIDGQGVWDPLWLLEQVRNGEKPHIGNTVAIIGGGNTAMDAARTAARLVGKGGKVMVIYRRTIKEMPADLGEIKAVIQEGIDIMELTGPIKINLKEGKVHSLTCCKMQFGPKDASGRRSPVVIADSEFEVPVDAIIPAVGQDLAFDFGLNEALKTLPGKYETQLPCVFIGGDALRGASTAINAIGDGRKVAQEIIDREKIGLSTRPANPRTPQSIEWHMIQRSKRKYPASGHTDATTQDLNFKLLTETKQAAEILDEASRCLLCDEVCNICTTVCPNMAFYSYKVNPVTLPVQKILVSNKGIELEPDGEFLLHQNYQILHISDWCNRCGNCNTFCPTAGAPYEEKPHLFISKKAYESENEGFFLYTREGYSVLHKKEQGKEFTLKSHENFFDYSSDWGTVIINKSDFSVVETKIQKGFEGEFALRQAAEMAFIIQGAADFLQKD